LIRPMSCLGPSNGPVEKLQATYAEKTRISRFRKSHGSHEKLDLHEL
jgi:hypothetical protein